MILKIKQCFCVVLAAGALCFISPSPAYADSPIEVVQSFVENILSMFSGKKLDETPSKTLIAPFAAPEDANQKNPEASVPTVLSVNDVNLDQPHRNPGDIGEWVDKVVAEVLTFDPDTYASLLVQMRGGCTDGAIAEYREWVEGTGIYAALQENGLQMNGVVLEKPYLLNEGVVDGSYKWLFEIPVVVSFIPLGAVTLSGEKAQKIETRNLIVTVQAGRVAQSRTEHGVLIESWKVRENKRKL